jgi:cytoskeleton protein RodZ
MADSEQSAAPQAAPSTPSLGELLREARVAKDLTIEQLATELRIEARQLSALEENRFEQIGVPVFVKGYIRQCGQRLGLDPSRLIEIYGRQTKLGEVEVKPSKPIRLRNERQITVWIVALLLLLLIAVGLAVWWLNGANFEIGAAAPAAQTPAARVEPAAAAVVVAEPAPVETAAGDAAPAVLSEAATSPPQANAGAATAVAATLDAPEKPATVTGAREAPTRALDVTFDSESWAEIVDARGQKLFFELGTAGKHLALRGEPPIAVTFGNADAVRLLVDGANFPIPTQGRQGKLVRFSVASDKE